MVYTREEGVVQRQSRRWPNTHAAGTSKSEECGQRVRSKQKQMLGWKYCGSLMEAVEIGIMDMGLMHACTMA